MGSLMVVAAENIPPRLRGRLALWLIEVRSGIYVGNYSVKVREMIWEQVEAGVEDGNVVMVWTDPGDAGYDFRTIGQNRRTPRDMDGVRLISFLPDTSG